jgi:hypothetical protein
MSRTTERNSANGGAVLDAIFVFIRRFVALSKSQARVAALWVVHTYLLAVADATPYLDINSAEKQSGKTRLLEVLEVLVANPWLTGRVTAAVLARKIDAQQPTLLLDESDAAFGSDKQYAEALRGVLNTGHRRGGKASCCVGQGPAISYQDFSTFCPKAIAGIGRLPDTVQDRAIPMRLKRAVAGEKVERFRRREVEAEASSLRAQIEAWCKEIEAKLVDARPELPQELTDRQQDGAEPLLAIADAAGGEWPQMARQALVELCTEAQSSDGSVGVQLLSDIRQIFDSSDLDQCASAELVNKLSEIETSPWGEWGHAGRPITKAKLASLLRPYGIAPDNIRVDGKVLKGYEREDFSDAWKRYLRSPDNDSPAHNGLATATTLQANTGAGSSDFSGRYTGETVAAPKCEIANKNEPCSGVALPEAQKGIEEEL